MSRTFYLLRKVKIDLVDPVHFKRKLINNIGFDDLDIKVSNELIEYIIDNYTMEAGVRDIKRKMEKSN